MRQVTIQNRNKRIAILGAALAAIALLSAFQPASATEVLETGRAGVWLEQGDFGLQVVVDEEGSRVCTFIWNFRTGEYRDHMCASGVVEVSDTLESASAQGTTAWSRTTTGKGKGAKAGGTSTSGTVTIDAVWTGTGDVTTQTPTFDSCSGWICLLPEIDSETSISRNATLSGTITDSEWGTFVLDGASGHLYQRIL